MTYEQTLDYLYTKLPMYQRIGTVAFKKDLTNIIKLCDAIGNPQRDFKSIHIAGTNGKGSTSHILSAVYQDNGYKVGLYTSPHLVDFRERIKINGQLCSEEFVISFVQQISEYVDEISPSFFEITVAMAFAYFAEKKVDIAIIETGLGGRLDSTNIIHPIASIITSIGYDHVDMLGDTLEKIATEKAGIIKTITPLVVGNIALEPMEVITNKAKEMNAPLHSYLHKTFETDLAGEHQQWNIGCALRCVELVNKIIPTEDKNNREALKHVRKISNFVGRWQILQRTPLVICDVGHNEEGFRLIAQQLKELNKPIHYLLGFVSDKDLDKIIPLLPSGQSYHFVKPCVIRGMNAELAQEKFVSHQIDGQAHGSMSDALAVIKKELADDELLFIGGSNFVVADALLLEQEGQLKL
ncbi:bifunctional folylpolyglutamate synthase/dihydrofolate synthase [Bacteroidia bacterium]|nr:bifunctional folylpolyglutamate synthase/dihydrofolate synthase [Bacteroidia bacterium]